MDSEQTPIESLKYIETLIGASASAVINAPEYNLPKLRDLLICLNKTELGPFNATDHKNTILALHRLIAKSATKVFEDIIPNYRIKQNEQEDNPTRLSKDVIKLRTYERNFSSIYKKLYLDQLKRMLDCIKNKPASTFYTDLIKTNASDRQALAETAIGCLGQVLAAHPHFNYRDQIISALVDYNAQTRHERCATLALNYLSKTLKNDKLGDVSLEIMSAISDIAKKRKLSVSASLFKTLLNLKLINVKMADEDRKAMKKAEAEKLASVKDKQSRKERKRYKKMKKLKSELLETEAHTTIDQKLKFHRTILKKLFVTYFRLMNYHQDLDGEPRETMKYVTLLPPVLEGVAKYAHLIDVALCIDLFPLLNRLLSNRDIGTNCKLHCLSTVFIIYRSLETELGAIDPEGFYKHFYSILTNLNGSTMDEAEFASLNSCIHLMLIKRAKHINKTRYCAFVRRLLILALNIPSRFVLPLIESIRIMSIQVPRVAALFDSSNYGEYDITIEDPDFSYADASVAWEMQVLLNHYDESVKTSAYALLRTN